LARTRQFGATYTGTVGEVFTALGRTLAFRRWPVGDELLPGAIPRPGFRYRHETRSVERVGRVVDVIRPVGLTLKETLHDPPCRVSLCLRWRIEPLASGSSVRLSARYELNHAAALRGRHWERRLQIHFRNQLRFVGIHLRRLQRDSTPDQARNSR
jgi:hypothetical protein